VGQIILRRRRARGCGRAAKPFGGPSERRVEGGLLWHLCTLTVAATATQVACDGVFSYASDDATFGPVGTSRRLLRRRAPSATIFRLTTECRAADSQRSRQQRADLRRHRLAAPSGVLISARLIEQISSGPISPPSNATVIDAQGNDHEGRSDPQEHVAAGGM